MGEGIFVWTLDRGESGKNLFRNLFGGVISPLLFSIIIDDVYNNIGQGLGRSVCRRWGTVEKR